MPLEGIEQPAYLYVDEGLRLRAYDGDYALALPWYEDERVRRDSEGVTDGDRRLGSDYVRRKYETLSASGELYLIEVLEDGRFVPVGDVTLKEENPPIVIGVARYRGRGIGSQVMRRLVARARSIGFQRIANVGAREWNIASQKMLENAGFTLVEHDRAKGRKVYEIDL